MQGNTDVPEDQDVGVTVEEEDDEEERLNISRVKSERSLKVYRGSGTAHTLVKITAGAALNSVVQTLVAELVPSPDFAANGEDLTATWSVAKVERSQLALRSWLTAEYMTKLKLNDGVRYCRRF